MAIDRSKTDLIKAKYEELTGTMSDPAVAGNHEEYMKYSKELGAIEPQYRAILAYEACEKEIEDLLAILDGDAGSDDEMREFASSELSENKEKLEVLEKELMLLMAPGDPRDNRSVIMEIRGGAGGEESALFAGDLFKMYRGYAALKGYEVSIVDSSPTELGGYKEIIFSVEGNRAFSRLKFESGVHRVQRVPVTESGGRIHTSTATVAVLPEADPTDVVINPKDLRIDLFRSSGAGGQHINKTTSAIRITHIPTGIVVTCQDERSQFQNKAKAMAVLQSRLWAMARESDSNAENDARRSQVGTGDRSERIRTYNYHQGRVTDHRIGLTLYRLNDILAGDLDEIVDALTLAQAADDAVKTGEE
ncbi:MAG: peptide chain release factor 1 [Clostridiales bacterium]|nr:peptide chain release factor 1 [Clostridiales bacterium]